jgi:hypothetical protein
MLNQNLFCRFIRCESSWQFIRNYLASSMQIHETKKCNNPNIIIIIYYSIYRQTIIEKKSSFDVTSCQIWFWKMSASIYYSLSVQEWLIFIRILAMQGIWKTFIESTKEKADVHAKIARFWSQIGTMFGFALILTSGIYIMKLTI